MKSGKDEESGYPLWKSVLVGFRPDGSDYVQLELPDLETEDMTGYWSQLVPVSDGFAGIAALTDKNSKSTAIETVT